jgi:hypothetical protein
MVQNDPFAEATIAETWSQYFLMTIVQTLGVSPSQGVEMIGRNFTPLGAMLSKGLPNAGFFLVRRLCQALYHSTAHMLTLFERDVHNNLAVLAALQQGITSQDREVSVMLMYVPFVIVVHCRFPLYFVNLKVLIKKKT